MGKGKLIETGVDRLIRLVQRKKRIPLAQAAKELSVPVEVIDEWAGFLEEEGVLGVEYKFTTPYLVEKALNRKELAKKAQEFGIKKEYFVRKAESVLESLEQQHASIDLIKQDFTKLKDALGGQVQYLEKEFAALAAFEKEKKTIESELQEHGKAFRAELEQQSRAVTAEARKFEAMIEEIKKERRAIVAEHEKTVSLRQQETKIMKQLDQLTTMVDRLRKRLVSQDTYILNSERNLRRLLAMSTKIGADITGRRDRLAKLIAASRKRQDELVAEQKDVVDKILKKSKSLKTESKNKSTTIKKLKVFFVKKHKVEKLISEVNQQHDKLRHDLTMLVKKAQVYDVYMKSKKHGRGVNELKTAFGTIDTRKKWLERKIKDLSKAFTDLTK